MVSSFFKDAALDLDADGDFSTSKLHNSADSLYWKHKVVVVSEDQEYNIAGIENALYRISLPSEIAMYINIGDVLTFVQEEDPIDDVFLRAFSNFDDKRREEHIKWKEFLGDNSLGIYVYGREFLFGLDRFRIQGFYFDVDAVSEEIIKLNRIQRT